jgi:hypothetical protein
MALSQTFSLILAFPAQAQIQRVWWHKIHWLAEDRVMGFWEDVGCMKTLTLCGTEDGYAPARSREAAFEGKGSFPHVDHAS